MLQIDSVFTNVSKGQAAPAAELQKAFNTTDVPTIVQEILKKGELQVGEKERAVELDELKREICTEVAGRCVDPGSKRPYPVGMIEKAMNEIGFSAKSGKSAKVQVSNHGRGRGGRWAQVGWRWEWKSGADWADVHHRARDVHCLQAIDLIKQLQATSTLPIMRAQMRVRITMPSKDGKRIKTHVLALVDKVEDDDWADEWELVRPSPG